MSDALGRDEPFARGPFREDGMTDERTAQEIVNKASWTEHASNRIAELTGICASFAAERDAALADVERLEAEVADVDDRLGHLHERNGDTIDRLMRKARKWKRRAKVLKAAAPVQIAGLSQRRLDDIIDRAVQTIRDTAISRGWLVDSGMVATLIEAVEGLKHPPPGHTDLMVTPESIDAFIERRPMDIRTAPNGDTQFRKSREF